MSTFTILTGNGAGNKPTLPTPIGLMSQRQLTWRRQQS